MNLRHLFYLIRQIGYPMQSVTPAQEHPAQENLRTKGNDSGVTGKTAELDETAWQFAEEAAVFSVD